MRPACPAPQTLTVQQAQAHAPWQYHRVPKARMPRRRRLAFLAPLGSTAQQQARSQWVTARLVAAGPSASSGEHLHPLPAKFVHLELIALQLGPIPPARVLRVPLGPFLQ